MTRKCPFARPIAGALAAALLAAAGPAAAAEGAPVPVRSQGFVFTPPDGPSVLRLDGLERPVAPLTRPDLAVPSVPVAQVMNGGGFGYTGFDYYGERIVAGRNGAHLAPREYVVTPNYVVPPRP